MEPGFDSDIRRSDLETWTLKDAQAWKEAELSGHAEGWGGEDLLLDKDPWMDDEVTLSPSGLARLGIHIS